MGHIVDREILLQRVIAASKKQKPPMNRQSLAMALGVNSSHLERLISGKRGEKRGVASEILGRIIAAFPELEQSVLQYLRYLAVSND